MPVSFPEAGIPHKSWDSPARGPTADEGVAPQFMPLLGNGKLNGITLQRAVSTPVSTDPSEARPTLFLKAQVRGLGRRRKSGYGHVGSHRFERNVLQPHGSCTLEQYAEGDRGGVLSHVKHHR